MKKVAGIFITVIILSPLNVLAQRGCCSHHGGVAGCQGGRQVCVDGTLSPTCTCSTSNSNSSSYYNRSQQASTYAPTYIYGCTDSNAYNYNSKANKDDGSCIEKIYGCMDKSAINYNEKANIKDESCQYKKVITETKKIKSKTIYKENNNLDKGTEKILKKGTTGKKEIIYEVITDNSGKKLSKTKIDEKIITKPQNKIIEKGTKENINIFSLIWLVSIITSFIYNKKNKTNKLIISKIDKTPTKSKVILYILYIFLIIPPIIDMIIIINNIIKNVK